MNKLILALLLSFAMTAHAQVSGPGNTFGGGGGTVFSVSTANDSFPQDGECLAWDGGVAAPCSSRRALYVASKSVSVKEVRFTISEMSNSGSSCTIKATVRKANAFADTEVGSITLVNKIVGGSVSGLSYSLSAGDSFRVMVGEGLGSTGCQVLRGSLSVEIS